MATRISRVCPVFSPLAGIAAVPLTVARFAVLTAGGTCLEWLGVSPGRAVKQRHKRGYRTCSHVVHVIFCGCRLPVVKRQPPSGSYRR